MERLVEQKGKIQLISMCDALCLGKLRLRHFFKDDLRQNWRADEVESRVSVPGDRQTRWAHAMHEQWGAFSAPCAQMWSCEQTAASSTSSTLLTCQQLSTRWLIKLISETKTGGSDGIKSGSFVCSRLCTEGMVSSQQQALMMGRRLWLLAMMYNVLLGNGKRLGTMAHLTNSLFTKCIHNEFFLPRSNNV